MATKTITPIVKDEGVGFNITTNSTRTTFIKCGQVTSILIKKNKENKDVLHLSLSKDAEKRNIELVFTEVTSPVLYTAEDLKQTIYQYNKGYKDVEVVEAVAGNKQTSTKKLSSSAMIIVDGITMTNNDVSFTEGGYKLTFTQQLYGGENIQIINL